MKIVIATGIFPPDIGGPAQYALELSRVWKAQGHTVAVKTFRFERMLPSGLRHLYFALKSIFAIALADYILILDTFSVAVPTVCVASLFRKKIVIRTGGDFLWESYVERTNDLVLFRDFYNIGMAKYSSKERSVFRLTTWVLAHASVIVFSTKWQKEVWEKPYELVGKCTAVIENYYGLKEVSYEPTQKNFIAGTRPLRWKNDARLAEAFEKVRTRDETLVYDNTTTPFRAFMDKVAHAYAIILPSLGDISPNMILDAIRHNKPFIVTRETGLAERITDCALFVDPENVNDIAEKIVWLSDARHYAEQKAKVESFVFTHTWEEIAEEFLALEKKYENFKH